MLGHTLKLEILLTPIKQNKNDFSPRINIFWNYLDAYKIQINLFKFNL